MSACACVCVCHEDEASIHWPGPCAACCEPGMDCDCGRALAYLVNDALAKGVRLMTSPSSEKEDLWHGKQ